MNQSFLLNHPLTSFYYDPIIPPSIKHHQLILIDHHQVQPPQPRIDQNLPRQLINPLSSLQLLPVPLLVSHLDD